MFCTLHQYFPPYVCSASMAVFGSALMSCFDGMLLRCFLNDFEMVQTASIITGITFVFIFHMRCISVVRSLYFRFSQLLS
jgi:choline-glycine betaine transporter